MENKVISALKQDVTNEIYRSVDYTDESLKICLDFIKDSYPNKLRSMDNIEDAIDYFADGYVDIATGKLLDWMGKDDNFMAVDRVLSEQGYNKENGITGAIQSAQYATALETLWSNDDSIKNLVALSYLESKLDDVSLSDADFEDFLDDISYDLKKDCYFSDIEDTVDEWVEDRLELAQEKSEDRS